MHLPSVWLLLLGVPLLQAQETTGIKMTVQNSSFGLPSERTVFIQGDRKREEYRSSYGAKKPGGSPETIYGPRLASITRCDLGRMFELNLDSSEYDSAPYPPKPFTKEEMDRRRLATHVTYLSEDQTLRVEETTTDTGERKEIFGHMARHVITKRNQIPLEGSRFEPQETVTDGWYIDLNQRLPCERKLPEGKHAHGYVLAVLGNQPQERVQFVRSGKAETGFAVNSLAITKGSYRLPDGSQKQTESKFEVRVTELKEGPLDPSLFEIPAGFKHVEHIERNPSGTASTGQWENLWDRIRASVSDLFNP